MTYAIFDIETRVDKALLNETLFRGRGLDDQAAYDRFRTELIEDRGTDFLPLSFHVPVSIAVGTASSDHVLQSVDSLAIADYGEERLAREFWERMDRFFSRRETRLVSFNGRQFDLPVLELAALRWGCPAPHYFNLGVRKRYAEDRHYDLFEFLTNFGVHRLRGGFQLAARLAGLPGKAGVDGSKVQGLWEEGRLEEIHAYCRRDVIQTYYLFLRIELVRGRLTPERHRVLWEETAPFRAILDE